MHLYEKLEKFSFFEAQSLLRYVKNYLKYKHLVQSLFLFLSPYSTISKVQYSILIMSYSILILDQSQLVVELLDTRVKYIQRNILSVTLILNTYSRYNEVSMDYFTLMDLAGYTIWVYPTTLVLTLPFLFSSCILAFCELQLHLNC